MSVKKNRSQEENQMIILVIQKRNDVRLQQNGDCGHEGITNLKYILKGNSEAQWQMGSIVADTICCTPNSPIPSHTQHLLYLQCPNVCCLSNITTSATYPKCIPLQPFFPSHRICFFLLMTEINGSQKGKDPCLRARYGL